MIWVLLWQVGLSLITHRVGIDKELDGQRSHYMPRIPESVRIARMQVRTVLGFHGLTDYAEGAEIITSELVTNAVQHACGDGTEEIGVTLARAWHPMTVTRDLGGTATTQDVTKALIDALAG